MKRYRLTLIGTAVRPAAREILRRHFARDVADSCSGSGAFALEHVCAANSDIIFSADSQSKAALLALVKATKRLCHPSQIAFSLTDSELNSSFISLWDGERVRYSKSAGIGARIINSSAVFGNRNSPRHPHVGTISALKVLLSQQFSFIPAASTSFTIGDGWSYVASRNDEIVAAIRPSDSLPDTFTIALRSGPGALVFESVDALGLTDSLPCVSKFDWPCLVVREGCQSGALLAKHAADEQAVQTTHYLDIASFSTKERLYGLPLSELYLRASEIPDTEWRSFVADGIVEEKLLISDAGDGLYDVIFCNKDDVAVLYISVNRQGYTNTSKDLMDFKHITDQSDYFREWLPIDEIFQNDANVL